MIVVYSNSIPFGEQQGATITRKLVEVDETIPHGAIWIDLANPTVEEDRKVEDFVGGPIPTKSDPDTPSLWRRIMPRMARATCTRAS